MKTQNVICSFLGTVRSDEMKMKMKIRVFIFIFIDGKERPKSSRGGGLQELVRDRGVVAIPESPGALLHAIFPPTSLYAKYVPRLYTTGIGRYYRYRAIYWGRPLGRRNLSAAACYRNWPRSS